MSLLHFSQILLTLIIPPVYFCTAPLPQNTIDQWVFVFVWVVDGRLWGAVFTYQPAPIGFSLGTHIAAVLEIHQAWQVYCTHILHRLWPATRTKISFSIRETFMSRNEGGFERTPATLYLYMSSQQAQLPYSTCPCGNIVMHKIKLLFVSDTV